MEGDIKGEAIVSETPISFLGGIDPHTGKITEKGHELEGQSIKDKVLVFPEGKGSTVGSYVLYHMAKVGTAPKAIINNIAEEIVAVGCIIAEIPFVDKVTDTQSSIDVTEVIKTGDIVKIINNKIGQRVEGGVIVERG